MDSVRKSHTAYLRTLDAKMLKAVKVYTANSTWFNMHCRSSLKGLPPYISEKFAYRASAIDHAINTAPALPRVTVYRGFCPYQGFESYKEGDLIRQKAPVSTTYDKRLAVKFMQQQLCCLLVVDLPVGTHGLLLESISRYPDESEVLLPRGGAFRIERIAGEKRSNGKQRTVYHATWVPPPREGGPASAPQKRPKANRRALKEAFVRQQRNSNAFKAEVADLMNLGMNRAEAEEEALAGIMHAYASKLNPSL